MSEILFRCSSLGYIMTESRSKSEPLSETAKTHCIDVMVSERYGRHTDIDNKYIRKGLAVEEDSITLYSRVKKIYFSKNEMHLLNGYIKGTPDLYIGEAINKADVIIDIKSSWDIFTYFRAIQPERINAKYYWQLQGYMALTGASEARVAYCLVNTPDAILSDEKRRLMWKMNVLSDTDETYEEACREIDKLGTYNDIPMAERVSEITIQRNDGDIARLYERVELCREYITKHLNHEPATAAAT